MKIGPIQWSVAMVAALGLHGGLLSMHEPVVETGAQGLGSGGLEISVTMTAAAMGADENRQAQEEVVSEIEEATDAPESQDTGEPAPTPPEPVAEVETPPDPEPQPVEEPVVEPTPEPVAEPEVEPVPEPLPEPEAVAMAETMPEPIPDPEPIMQEVQPEPEPIPEEVTPVVDLPRPEMPEAPPRPEETPVVQQAAVPQETVPQETAEPVETEEVTEPVEATEPAGAPAQAQVASIDSIASAGASATAQAGQSTDAATSQGGDAVVAPSPDYLSHLRYWIERHKEYPRLARRRGMEGVVVVALRVSRDGALMTRGIREGSGFDILDEETMELLSRADPMPAFPTDMKGKYLDVVVPIEYSLRGG